MEGDNSRRVNILAKHLGAVGLNNDIGNTPHSTTHIPQNALSAHDTRAANGLQMQTSSRSSLTGANETTSEELQAILDHDNPGDRARLKEVMRDPLFTPRWWISVEEERELALERLRRLCHSGAFSITDFRTNPLRIFAAHECAALADVSMATKMTVQVGHIVFCLPFNFKLFFICMCVVPTKLANESFNHLIVFIYFPIYKTVQSLWWDSSQTWHTTSPRSPPAWHRLSQRHWMLCTDGTGLRQQCSLHAHDSHL